MQIFFIIELRSLVDYIGETEKAAWYLVQEKFLSMSVLITVAPHLVVDPQWQIHHALKQEVIMEVMFSLTLSLICLVAPPPKSQTRAFLWQEERECENPSRRNSQSTSTP